MSLDRFSQGKKDPQEVAPITFCSECGGEIFPYDIVYQHDGNFIHDDSFCVRGYLEGELGFERGLAMDLLREE